MNKVLIVEDEVALANGTKRFLDHNGLIVDIANSGKEAIFALEKNRYDIVLLDIMLPDMRGEAICKHIKQNYKNIGVICLTALSMKTNIIDGFSAGADDYITKPFDPDILLVRINSLLKRVNNEEEVYSGEKNELNLGPAGLDMLRGVLMYDEDSVTLTSTELSILHYLAKSKGYVTSQEILGFIYNSDGGAFETRTISVHITKIRKKIKQLNLESVILISTKYKKGYKLEIKD